MKIKYTGIIAGGLGEGAWDKEFEVEAEAGDIRSALNQAEQIAKEAGGAVVEIGQGD